MNAEPDLSFLDDQQGEWVGGHWLPAPMMAERHREEEYERLEREGIAEFGGG